MDTRQASLFGSFHLKQEGQAFFAWEWACMAARMWQIHPSIPPDPTHRPGVTINQTIAHSQWPVYICPTPGIRKLSTAATPGSALFAFDILGESPGSGFKSPTHGSPRYFMVATKGHPENASHHEAGRWSPRRGGSPSRILRSQQCSQRKMPGNGLPFMSSRHDDTIPVSTPFAQRQGPPNPQQPTDGQISP